MVAPALAASIVAGMMFAVSSRGGLGELLEGGVDGRLVALGAPLLERLDPLALDLGVGGEDAAVLAGGQRASPRPR